MKTPPPKCPRGELTILQPPTAGQLASVFGSGLSPQPDIQSCLILIASFVERQNLTMRMQLRRFTTTDECVLQKMENYLWALALHYNGL
jgi:hypothetical protein